MNFISIPNPNPLSNFNSIPEKVTDNSLPWSNLKLINSPTEELTPVLIVPGLGGSRIYDTPKSDLVWVRLLHADTRFRQVVLGKMNKETQWYEPFDPNVKVSTDLGDETSWSGLNAISKLNPYVYTRYGPFEDIFYFYDMINSLISRGYEPGKNLFGAPYLFFQSNDHPRIQQQLSMQIDSIHVLCGKKLMIVSHSMGGLVTKLAWARDPKWFESRVDTWITMGTPFQGAMGTVTSAMLQGYYFGPVYPDTCQVFSLTSPAIHQLMGDFQFNWEPVPYVQWIDSKTGETRKVNYIDFPDLITKVTKNVKIEIDSVSHATPFDKNAFELALQVRQKLNDFKPSADTLVKFYSIYSQGEDTPYSVVYDDPIDESDLASPHKFHTTYISGDSTVPLQSAQADNLPAVERWVFTDVRHANIQKQKWSINKVLELLGTF